MCGFVSFWRFVFHLSSSCDIGELGMGSAPLSLLGSQPIAMLLVSVYLITLFHLIVVSFSPSVFFFRCVLHSLPLPLSSCLGCIPQLLGLPSLRFMRLPLVCFYCLCGFICVFYFYFYFLFIATMAFAGYSFSSVCFPCLSPIFGLIWFGSVYHVTTAGFVADQLM